MSWDDKAQLAAEYLTAQKRMPKVTSEYVEPVLVDMARWQREALLSDEAVERAARAFERKWNQMAKDDQADNLTDNQVFIEAATRAALTAAIEGGGS